MEQVTITDDILIKMQELSLLPNVNEFIDGDHLDTDAVISTYGLRYIENSVWITVRLKKQDSTPLCA